MSDKNRFVFHIGGDGTFRLDTQKVVSRRSLWLRLSAVFLFFLLLAGCVWLFLTPFFLIKEVYVESSSKSEVTQKQAKTSLLTHFPVGRLPFVSASEIQKSLQADYPIIRSVSVVKIYPETVRLTLVDYHVFALLEQRREGVLQEIPLRENGILAPQSKTAHEWLLRIEIENESFAPGFTGSVFLPEEQAAVETLQNMIRVQMARKIHFFKISRAQKEYSVLLDNGMWFYMDASRSLSQQVLDALAALSVSPKKDILYFDTRIAGKVFLWPR